MQFTFSRQSAWLTALALLFVTALAAQYPAYDPPLDGPLLVTGTFGELRSDHFHAGLDFRAGIGTPVLSIADGYVSRIVISAGGYGQAIYVDHPEGYRSLYGHLSALRPDLMDTVRSRQYAEERFTLDLRFDSTAFPVSAGEPIGAVGNRGYSFGPHLHFEVRETDSDAPVNPLHFGIEIADTRRPQLRFLKVYTLDEQSGEIGGRDIELRRRSDGDYFPAEPEILVTGPAVGFGIKAYDRQNAMPNFNGIYAAGIYRDSTLLHGFRYDRIPYEETRYLNAHTDYADWKEKTSWFHRLFRLPGDGLSIYDPPVKNPPIFPGRLDLPPNVLTPLRIEVSDWAGNRSQVNLTVVYRPDTTAAPPIPYQYDLPFDEASYIRTRDLELDFPAGSFYRDLRFCYRAVTDASAGVLSRVHHLHRSDTPLHRSARLTIKPTVDIPDSLRHFLVVARCPTDPDAAPVSYGPALDAAGKPLGVPIQSFGDYCLLLDTLPPTVEILSMPTRRYPDRQIRLRITDNFSTSGKARGLRYRATIDNKWILLEYDLKRDELFLPSDIPLPAGSRELRVGVKDDRGNETIFRRTLADR